MAKTITHQIGRYSKIELDDGARVSISIEGESAKIVKLGHLGLPGELIGRVYFPFAKLSAQKNYISHHSAAGIEELKKEGKSDSEITILQCFAEQFLKDPKTLPDSGVLSGGAHQFIMEDIEKCACLGDVVGCIADLNDHFKKFIMDELLNTPGASVLNKQEQNNDEGEKVMSNNREEFQQGLKKVQESQAHPENWPKTVDEAVKVIVADLTEEDKQAVIEKKENQLIEFHLGWGTGIRNMYGLHTGNQALLDSCDTNEADTASMVIIKAVWEKLKS